MTNYGRFAEVYDVLMTDIPYDAYVQWIQKYAPSATHPTLLDVGCGTGVLASKFYEAGYRVSGLDLSEEMLMMAQQRFAQQQQSIFLVCQSMDELDGFENLDVVTIPIDSLNYVREEAAVDETFKRIYDTLREGGQIFFDVHSVMKMDEIFMDGPFTYDDGEITYVWHTEEGEAPHSVYHDMTFFVEAENGLYERFEEEHYQRTYTIECYIDKLQRAGFKDIVVTADFTEEVPTEASQRIFFRAVK